MYMPKTIEELNQVRDECQSMVTKRAGVSGITAIIPIPGADVAADIGMLLQLLPAINKKFGLSKEQVDNMDEKTRVIVMEIAKKLGNTLIGKFITKELITQIVKKVATRFVAKQVLKYIPIAGQIASASISFAAMKYLGNSHVSECYDLVHRIICDKRTETEAEIIEIQPESSPVDASEVPKEAEFSRAEIIETIRQLKELCEIGAIEEEEFQTKKKELLARL